MDKPTLTRPHDGILLRDKKGRTMNTLNDLCESQRHSKEIKETVSKHSILCV